MKNKIVRLIRSLDNRLFFPYLEEAKAEKYYRYREVIQYEFEPSSLLHVPEPVRAYFERCTKEWELEKFHFCYNDGCTIEPSVGWGVTKKGRLIPQSLWNNYVHQVNRPLYLKYRLFPKKKLRLKSAISLHYSWGNYWHFYNDILGQLKLADLAGLPADTPVIIAAGLAQMSYFKAIVALSPELQQRNWILQDKHTHIYCEEAHFFNTFWDHRENFDAVLNYMHLLPSLQAKDAGTDRIFVARSRNRGRNILNMEEVEAVLKKHRFQLVDCDSIGLQDQIEVFRNAAFIIGIHGAGLTNIIYRQGHPLKVLEIFSAGYLNPCYYWFCRQYGYDYYSVMGSAYTEPGTTAGSFTIDISEFEERLVSMIEGTIVNYPANTL